MSKRECICFAYFADNKFLGWYSDTFGTITYKSPKIYGYSEDMIDTITKNFRYKLKKSKEDWNVNLLNNTTASTLLNNSLNNDNKTLAEYTTVELRVVECPIYDGPNPEFDKEDDEKYLEENRRLMTEAGIFDIPAPSVERSRAVTEWNKTYPKYHTSNWIYADYNKVKEWTSVEPTEFLDVIKSE